MMVVTVGGEGIPHRWDDDGGDEDHGADEQRGAFPKLRSAMPADATVAKHDLASRSGKSAPGASETHLRRAVI